jgi:primary-amine oxidase
MKYAGLNEIFVPYHPGQPRPEDALDGMGNDLQELIPGKDCIPGSVCAMFDAQGKTTGRKVVAMHEEATGPAYIGEAGRAPGKMLVLWCASKLGDYTYFIRWRFKPDGSFMPQVGLTGKLSHTRPTPVAGRGAMVSTSGARVFAPSHVHNFYYRLDFDIDGPENDTVEEFNHKQDVPNESFGSQDRWTPLKRECARSLDPLAFRSWRVVDHGSFNRHGMPRSYELVPGGNGIFRGAASEMIAQADFWVQRFKPSEFPLSATDDLSVKAGMPRYFNDEPVEKQDVVVWYAMHVHHLPRTENWPQMPVEWAGFEIVPRDFLDRAPINAVKEPQ